LIRKSFLKARNADYDFSTMKENDLLGSKSVFKVLDLGSLLVIFLAIFYSSCFLDLLFFIALTGYPYLP
jgi:hypothetical protein